MLQSIRNLFDFASSGLKVTQELGTLLRRRRGDARLLLEEVKANQDLCRMVIEEGTDPMRVIPELRTNQYDALLGAGFDFDGLGPGRIRSFPDLERSDLAGLVGKTGGALIEDIYDKTKELERRYRLDRNNPRTDWRRRVINLYKRIVLLVYHLRRAD
ncbi:MAG TPA: hypothetical protein VKA76_06025 [Gammaproteobacteria bacterium]|nr:hypothetical protein [Gammaproteobacteria bacterium]